jgi:hypothetical protein
MPQSITIAAFVLGAVLLLIGLLGGGFKIFGAEVSGNAGQGPRVAAGGLGALFIAIGLVGSLLSSTSSPAEHRDGPPPPRVTPQPEEPRQKPEEQRAKREEVPNIAGEWVDEIGTVYQIRQTGAKFDFVSYNSNNRIGASGDGEIAGRHATNNFEIDTPRGRVHGTGDGSISDDGRTMYGTFSDPYYGRYGHTLTRPR